jgi:hypothetical protein
VIDQPREWMAQPGKLMLWKIKDMGGSIKRCDGSIGDVIYLLRERMAPSGKLVDQLREEWLNSGYVVALSGISLICQEKL